MSDAQRELVGRLGDQLPAAWRDAFAANPRHLFVPERIWSDTDAVIDRHADPSAWWALVCSDSSVITQLHDGAAFGNSEYPISSSSSQPSVMADMLTMLDPQPGMRVLEAGTGTGWNAAILGTHVGDANVTTVEVDPALAETAGANLIAAGHPDITTACGDGAAGWPPTAPYERILATYATPTVPYAWVDQTSPGAVIVTPWGPAYDNSGLVRLRVSADGTRAEGGIVGWATFMIDRSQRLPIRDDDLDATSNTAPVPEDVDLVELLTNEHARMGVGLRLPATRRWVDLDSDGWFDTLWLRAPGATATVTAEGARQAGTRRLWDEAVAAYRWWRDSGKPTRDQYRISVTAEGQTVWLGEGGRRVQFTI